MSSVGFIDVNKLPTIVQDKLVVLALLEPGQRIGGVGHRVSDKTYKIDLENIFDIYHT